MRFKLLGIFYLVVLLSCKEKEHLQLSGIYHNEHLDRYIIFQEGRNYYIYDGPYGYIAHINSMAITSPSINEPQNYTINGDSLILEPLNKSNLVIPIYLRDTNIFCFHIAEFDFDDYMNAISIRLGQKDASYVYRGVDTINELHCLEFEEYLDSLFLSDRYQNPKLSVLLKSKRGVYVLLCKNRVFNTGPGNRLKIENDTLLSEYKIKYKKIKYIRKPNNYKKFGK